MNLISQASSSAQWLTEKDVARITNLSVSTIQKHRFYCKGIPYSKIGKSVRYAEADVITFMETARISVL